MDRPNCAPFSTRQFPESVSWPCPLPVGGFVRAESYSEAGSVSAKSEAHPRESGSTAWDAPGASIYI